MGDTPSSAQDRRATSEPLACTAVIDAPCGDCAFCSRLSSARSAMRSASAGRAGNKDGRHVVHRNGRKCKILRASHRDSPTTAIGMLLACAPEDSAQVGASPWAAAPTSPCTNSAEGAARRASHTLREGASGPRQASSCAPPCFSSPTLHGSRKCWGRVASPASNGGPPPDRRSGPEGGATHAFRRFAHCPSGPKQFREPSLKPLLQPSVTAPFYGTRQRPSRATQRTARPRAPA